MVRREPALFVSKSAQRALLVFSPTEAAELLEFIATHRSRRHGDIVHVELGDIARAQRERRQLARNRRVTVIMTAGSILVFIAASALLIVGVLAGNFSVIDRIAGGLTVLGFLMWAAVGVRRGLGRSVSGASVIEENHSQDSLPPTRSSPSPPGLGGNTRDD
jgi:hypothetical protein